MVKLRKILETKHGAVMGTFAVAIPIAYKPFVSCRINNEGTPFNVEFFTTKEQAVENMNRRVRILDSRFGK